MTTDEILQDILTFDVLGKAVTDLQEAVEPLANFSRMLSR